MKTSNNIHRQECGTLGFLNVRVRKALSIHGRCACQDKSSIRMNIATEGVTFVKRRRKTRQAGFVFSGWLTVDRARRGKIWKWRPYWKVHQQNLTAGQTFLVDNWRYIRRYTYFDGRVRQLMECTGGANTDIITWWHLFRIPSFVEQLYDYTSTANASRTHGASAWSRTE